MDKQHKETMRQIERLHGLVRTGASDSLIRDKIRKLCRIWKITDPVNYEFAALPELSDAEMAEVEKLVAEFEELEDRKAPARPPSTASRPAATWRPTWN